MSAVLWLRVVVFNQQVWSMPRDGERLKEGGSAALSGHGAGKKESNLGLTKGLNVTYKDSNMLMLNHFTLFKWRSMTDRLYHVYNTVLQCF